MNTDLLKNLSDQTARRRAEIENEMVLDRTERQMRQLTTLMQRMTEDAQKLLERHSKRTEHGFYYRYLDRDELADHVPERFLADAADALAYVREDLRLNDLPLHLTWYCRSADQVQAKRHWSSADPRYFSERPGLNGWIYWNTVLDTGSVYVSTYEGRLAIKTIAHEAKHIAQRLQVGPECPTGAHLNELEFEARRYADSVFEALRERSFARDLE